MNVSDCKFTTQIFSFRVGETDWLDLAIHTSDAQPKKEKKILTEAN
jgi:hypothetical protein